LRATVWGRRYFLTKRELGSVCWCSCWLVVCVCVLVAVVLFCWQQHTNRKRERERERLTLHSDLGPQSSSPVFVGRSCLIVSCILLLQPPHNL
jgi:hypothetical protein